MHYQYLPDLLNMEEGKEQIESHPIYSTNQLRSIDRKKVPRHIAIIPDGNRRWAKKHMTQSVEGHSEGGDVLNTIVKAAKELGVKVLTVYTFSTENWNRSSVEVNAYMRLIESRLTDKCEEMVANGVRFHTIGELSKLPDYLIRTIQQTKAATAACNQIDLIFAINYGGRDEIRRAIISMAHDCLSQKLQANRITEEIVGKYLDTAQWPDPELLIRTSGEMRISNFLLWQMSYSEVYMADVLWPDFTPQHLLEAIINYQQRERRLGGI